MKRIILAVVLSASLGGCASFQAFEQKLQNVVQAATSATVSRKAVVVSGNVANGIIQAATDYLNFCAVNNTNVVCKKTAIAKLIPEVRRVQENRNRLEVFLRDHPGQLGQMGLYDALNQSVSAINDVLMAYRLNGAVQ